MLWKKVICRQMCFMLTDVSWKDALVTGLKEKAILMPVWKIKIKIQLADIVKVLQDQYFYFAWIQRENIFQISKRI